MVTGRTFRVTSNLQKRCKSFTAKRFRRENAEKNHEYPAQAGSGRANQGDRGAERYPGYVEVCPHCRRLAAYVGHRRSDFKDSEFGEVPGLSNCKKTDSIQKTESEKAERLIR